MHDGQLSGSGRWTASDGSGGPVLGESGFRWLGFSWLRQLQGAGSTAWAEQNGAGLGGLRAAGKCREVEKESGKGREERERKKKEKERKSGREKWGGGEKREKEKGKVEKGEDWGWGKTKKDMRE
ncbi:hypothetical protein NMG60_11032149 [Bertholletia excelsa]